MIISQAVNRHVFTHSLPLGRSAQVNSSQIRLIENNEVEANTPATDYYDLSPSLDWEQVWLRFDGKCWAAGGSTAGRCGVHDPAPGGEQPLF